MKYIVSHKHRFVYFVVPKAACSSIKTALIPVFNLSTDGYFRLNRFGEERLQIHDLFDDSPNQITRARLEEIWGRRIHGYFTFAFVRNPWDRLVSCWHQKIKDREWRAGTPGLKPLNAPANRPDAFDFEMSFDAFLRTVCEIPDEQADIHFRSQYTILQSPWKPETLLPGFIGKFENLDADFDHVRTRIGLREKMSLPHALKSRTRDSNRYRNYYNDELRDLVYDRFSRDIDEFGYEF